MPASRRAAAPVVEEPAAEARDYTEYRDKEPTPTMSDFADWIVQEVGIEYPTAKELAAFRNGVRLGGTLRMEFQASDMNKERRAARRAAREAQASANGQAAEPEVAATPPARGRGRGKTAATAAATPAPPKATAGKARGRRGAPVAAATGADAEAPY